MALPGWDSLETVKAIHSALEGWALVFFAILVVCDVVMHFGDDVARVRLATWLPFFKNSSLVSFGLAVLLEICAYPYSQRNDELSTAVITALREQTADTIGMAKGFERDIAQARKDAAEANRTAEQERLARIRIEEEFARRRLPQDQHSEIGSRLKRFAGDTASVWFNQGDSEGCTFASDIVSVLPEAQWSLVGPPSSLMPIGAHTGEEAQGLQWSFGLLIRPPDRRARSAPCGMLRDARSGAPASQL
jgi:hypothetical protein